MVLLLLLLLLLLLCIHILTPCFLTKDRPERSATPDSFRKLKHPSETPIRSIELSRSCENIKCATLGRRSMLARHQTKETSHVDVCDSEVNKGISLFVCLFVCLFICFLIGRVSGESVRHQGGYRKGSIVVIRLLLFISHLFITLAGSVWTGQESFR